MSSSIVWKTVTLPDGIAGVPYEAGIAVTGAAGAITALALKGASGALPAGIVCNSSDHVRMTGTPTTPGTYTFKLTITESAGAVDSGTLSIRVRDVDNADTADLAAADKNLADVKKLRFP